MCRRVFKRDDFNISSEILFFEKENGSFELLYFKTAVWHLVMEF